jgi:hypothetical protein
MPAQSSEVLLAMTMLAAIAHEEFPAAIDFAVAVPTATTAVE